MPTKCMDFLTTTSRGDYPGTICVFGGDNLLTRESRRAVTDWIVGPDPDDFTYSSYDGAEVELCDVLDDLHTRPFIGDCRLVVVENADKFVSENRPALERFASTGSDCGVLLLEPKTWAATTKLYKLVEKEGLSVDAREPTRPRDVEQWCIAWADWKYDKKLERPAASLIVESVGAHLSVIDQELQKLAAFGGASKNISRDVVARLVAGTHVEETYMLLSYALEGQLDKSLAQLDRMLISGVNAAVIMGTMTTQLRKLTRAARAVVAGQPMRQAIHDAAGITHPFAARKAEAQLRHLGRERMAGMYRRLLLADNQLKGGSAMTERTVIERLLLELAVPRSRKTVAQS